MSRPHMLRRTLLPGLALMALCALVPHVPAFFWERDPAAPQVADLSKSMPIGGELSFSQEDIQIKGGKNIHLTGITLTAIPDAGAGSLTIGGQPLEPGAFLDHSAIDGLRFKSAPAPAVTTTSFTFAPSFSNGQEGEPATVQIHLLAQKDLPPVARNMELSTYQNVAITGYFDAVDSEGGPLAFQLISTPARGAVELAEDGSSQFVFTPYENKTGNDRFTYVAMDAAGNVSAPATVTLRIRKPGVQVTYADLAGHPAHKAAIRLAEEEIYVGRCIQGRYFFDPDQPVERAQFLTMAMAVSGLEELEGVALTGFTDDSAIPAWAKGPVSAALKAGAIQGSRDASGAPVFGAREDITRGEAAAMLDDLLEIADVPLEVFAPGEGHWAAQAAANLSASGIQLSGGGPSRLSDHLTMAEAAQMLDGALDVVKSRGSSWISW